ncbi:FR47-like protein [Pedococcus dokdonensis]|uniref:FR47-like protein n=1 Tax=Pedococcus dokdonensis TaxID=443156 RepID=A0A1H0PLP9_9MICO|nr:GNAT family N-acetyltransferase [Pedococcus dokdonensis]SDP06027.1 FR47-like protein [Pedococcus dokdonensis]
MTGLRVVHTHEEALVASEGSSFVRFDVPAPLDGEGFSLGRALALPRRTHTRRLGLLVLGPPDHVDQLLAAVLARGPLDPEIRSVTVQRGSLDPVARHLPLGEGNDWEWLCTTASPPEVAAESRLLPLDGSHQREIANLLAEANPGTDARPFEHPGQDWVGVRDEGDRLVACGVRERSLAGHPILSGITVDAAHRGRGLGLAVTAYLTRRAVAEAGVCTLGMYSHNAVARRLYVGLGYGDVHEWSSRRFS